MFQVQIKINNVVSVVPSNQDTKKKAIAEVKRANPTAKYLMCWEGNPPVTKSPKGLTVEQIKDKYKKRNNAESITN